jgi:ABC-2 type transport system ATP-binding protein/lipopolysaccharide transport system ATP-binding protein
MGMTRADIRRRFDEIVEFAGVEPFLETPLKRYSSGMQLRLAFAVAAFLEPELMLVDEILAVGDAEFQRRCMSRMRTLGEDGRTVIFVSHDMGAVTALCSRAVWAHHGQIMRDGESREVVSDYYASVVESSGSVEFEDSGETGIDQAAITDLQGRPMSQASRDTPFALQARVVTKEAIPGLDLYMFVTKRDGTVLLNESWRDQEGMPRLAPEPGRYVVRMEVPPVLPPGDYVFTLWLGTEYSDFVLREALTFTVQPLPDDRQEAITRRRNVQPPVRWTSQRVGS